MICVYAAAGMSALYDNYLFALSKTNHIVKVHKNAKVNVSGIDECVFYIYCS